MVQIFGGLIAITMILIRYSSFGEYQNSDQDFTRGRWPAVVNAIFNGLGHYIFIISICMILLPIFIGKISIVRNILSADIFRPLSRISFSIYHLCSIQLLMLYYSQY